MNAIVVILLAVLAISCCDEMTEDTSLETRDSALVKVLCKQPIDLALLLDSSNSISSKNWQKVKDFAKEVIDEIGDVSQNGSHVAVVRYSTDTKLDLKFNTFKGNELNGDNIKKRIDGLSHLKGITFMDKALKLANEQVFTKDAGMREEKNIKKVTIILTDGKQTTHKGAYTPLEVASKPLKDREIYITAIGVGPDINLKELVDMATSPDYVYSVKGFDDLKSKVAQFQLQTCDCYKKLDIGIILDESRSVGLEGYKKGLFAISSLVERLHISPKGSRLSVLRFGEHVRVDYRFTDDRHLAAVKSMVENLQYGKGGMTKTSLALETAGENFFKPGTPGNRPDVPDIAIVFTDGESHDGVNGALSKYMKNTKTVVVGIGHELKNYKPQLKTIAHGDETNLIMVESYDKLRTKLNEIVKETCED